MDDRTNNSETNTADVYSTVTSPESLVPENDVYPQNPAEFTENDPNSTVAVSGNGGGTPKWFYIIFAITFIGFICVSVLLFMTLKNNQPGQSSASPSPTQAVLATLTPSQTPTPTISTEQKLLDALKNVGTSDEISDIETDLQKTDLKVLDMENVD